jgi:hypothetical protein
VSVNAFNEFNSEVIRGDASVDKLTQFIATDTVTSNIAELKVKELHDIMTDLLSSLFGAL